MARLFLGLDSSTQSLSAVVIDYDSRKVVYEKSLNYDQRTAGLQNPERRPAQSRPAGQTQPAVMWADALDLIFAEMKKDGVALGEILAISGSGQQHGSVYLNTAPADALAKLNPEKIPGRKFARRIFARNVADLDGFLDCRGMRRNPQGTRWHQGHRADNRSDTFERFTGPQIRKFYKTEPEAFAQTAGIALVSSFMASLLAEKLCRLITAMARG